MLTAIMLASMAFAQDTVTAGEVPKLNAQLFRPTIDGRHTLWTDDASVDPNAYTSARFLLEYVNDPLVYSYSDGTTDGGRARSISARRALYSDTFRRRNPAISSVFALIPAGVSM